MATCTPDLVGDPQAGVDRGGRRAPVLVQLESAGAAAGPAPASPRRDTVLPLPSRTTLTGMVSIASCMRARFHAPAVTVVALVPSAGPVPPPMTVVMPDASASSTICGQIRCTWQSMAPAVRIRPLPERISVDGPDHQRGIDAGHRVGVAGLADADDPSVAHTDVGLDDAPVIEDEGAGDDEVGRARGAGAARLAHRFADHLAAAEHRLVAADAQVAFDLDDEIGVGKANVIAGGRPVEPPVVSPRDLNHRALRRPRRAARRRRGHHRSGPATPCGLMPGSKRTDVPGGDVESLAAGRCAVELQRRVGLGEVVVRADLHRSVTAVHHVERCAREPDVELDHAVGTGDLAGNHGTVHRALSGSAGAA